MDRTSRVGRPRRCAACAALLIATACAGPELSVSAPPGGVHHLDGRTMTGERMPLPYYGTAVLDAFPQPVSDLEFKLLPGRTAVSVPEPVTPWLFPLDLPLECLWHLFHGAGDAKAEAAPVPNPAPALKEQVPGADALRARAAEARVQR